MSLNSQDVRTLPLPPFLLDEDTSHHHSAAIHCGRPTSAPSKPRRQRQPLCCNALRQPRNGILRAHTREECHICVNPLKNTYVAGLHCCRKFICQPCAARLRRRHFQCPFCRADFSGYQLHAAAPSLYKCPDTGREWCQFGDDENTAAWTGRWWPMQSAMLSSSSVDTDPWL